jgi:Zn-dependent protease with chaperone function
MEDVEFKRLVARLEREAAVSPSGYRMRVAGLALLGFGILLVLLCTMGFGLLLIAGLAIAVIATGGKALLLVLKLGKAIVLLALPAWYVTKAGVKALFVRLPAPQGREIGPAQAPALFEALDRMRRQMKGPRFHHVLVVDEVNAAIVQRPAFGLFGWPRNYLMLGLPLLEAMPADEALSVLAHEYGHLAGSHGHFSAFIYRLRHSWGTVQAHVDEMQGWVAKLVAPMVRWYAPYFNAYTFVLARADEYQADAASAELVGAGPAARALMRVNIVGPQHQRFMEHTYERIADEPAPPADLMRRWAQEARSLPPDGDARASLRGALDREGHFADSHPTLRARLRPLLGGAEPGDEPPPPLAGPSAAEEWLGPLADRLRDEFQQQWADRVRTPWGERHAEHEKDRQRLADLRAAPERSDDDTLAMLRLAMRLEPDTEVVEPLAAFNAAHPDHATGLYTEALARLARGDDAGLPLLERVVAIDPDATKPACERAHAFLVERGDKEAAGKYAERWQARHAFEQAREAQVRRIDPAHALAPHGLDPQVVAAIRAELVGDAVKHVEAIYLSRRVIPADPDVVLYVMGVKLTWWGSRSDRPQKIVKRLAALELPVSMTIVSLAANFAPLKAKFEAIEGARLL